MQTSVYEFCQTFNSLQFLSLSLESLNPGPLESLFGSTLLETIQICEKEVPFYNNRKLEMTITFYRVIVHPQISTDQCCVYFASVDCQLFE
jgi:hypothetical protein